MKKLRAFLGHHAPFVHSQFKKWKQRFKSFELPEARLLNSTSAAEPRETRINLVIPVISRRNSFGGVATALRFFEKLSASYDAARIVVTQEFAFEYEPDRWTSWELVKSDQRPRSNRCIAYSSDGRPLAISASDIFVATHWTTAQQVKHWLIGQAQSSGSSPKPFVYLIQDYEPAFYAWSSEYLLAEATYNSSAQILAVFNTGHLQDFFKARGYSFLKSYAFTPALNPALAKERPALGAKKCKLILVYGRPSIPRNAFSLLLAGLREWARIYPAARDWKVLSVGELHPSLQLIDDMQLQSAGKLSLSEYGKLLADAAIGVSLMVSPHPSYPPLELAAFGAKVITNNFANKDLSEFSDGVVSLKEVTPFSIAQALIQQCERFSPDEAANLGGLNSLLLDAEQEEFPFLRDLSRDWHECAAPALK